MKDLDQQFNQKLNQITLILAVSLIIVTVLVFVIINTTSNCIYPKLNTSCDYNKELYFIGEIRYRYPFRVLNKLILKKKLCLCRFNPGEKTHEVIFKFRCNPEYINIISNSEEIFILTEKNLYRYNGKVVCQDPFSGYKIDSKLFIVNDNPSFLTFTNYDFEIYSLIGQEWKRNTEVEEQLNLKYSELRIASLQKIERNSLYLFYIHDQILIADKVYKKYNLTSKRLFQYRQLRNEVVLFKAGYLIDFGYHRISGRTIYPTEEKHDIFFDRKTEHMFGKDVTIYEFGVYNCNGPRNFDLLMFSTGNYCFLEFRNGKVKEYGIFMDDYFFKSILTFDIIRYSYVFLLVSILFFYQFFFNANKISIAKIYWETGHFASLSKRLLARVLDFILMFIIIMWKLELNYIFVILFILLFFEGFTGYTPGKFLLGIKVVNRFYEPIGFLKALVRNFMLPFDLIPYFLIFDCFLIGKSDKWQRLGDVITGSIVVEKFKEI